MNNEDKKKSKKVGLWKAFKVEASDRWWSTKERVIKVLGIIFIPLIYGFTCIAAFWNPLDKMGSVPAAIASLDQQQVLVQDYNTGDVPYDHGKTECIGIPEYWSDVEPMGATKVNFPEENKFPENLTLTDYLSWDFEHPSVKSILTEGGSILHYSHTILENGLPNKQGGAQMVSFMDSIMDNWQDGNLGDAFTYDSKQNVFQAKINDQLNITNLKYHNVNDDTPQSRQYAHDASSLAELDEENNWDIKNTEDYVQVSIPSNFTELLINYVDSNITNNTSTDYMKQLRSEKISFWLTYDKSFFAAKIWDGQAETLTAMTQKAIPSILGTLTGIQIDKIVATIRNQPNATTPGYSWLYTGPNVSYDLNWSDHYWSDGNIHSTQEEIKDEDTPTLTFKTNTLYTIPNEEYRDALMKLTKPDGDKPNSDIYDKISEKITPSSPYLVPSIEGITTINNGNNKWNMPVGNNNIDPNSYTALLTQITRATTIISEIPDISNAIAGVIDGVANGMVTKMFPDTSKVEIQIAIKGTTVNKLLSSDQFISAMLMQDPRYMMADSEVPEAAFLRLIIQGTPITASFNFGGILALMCYRTDGTDDKNAFQQIGLVSSYANAKDNAAYYNNLAPWPLAGSPLTISLASDLLYGEVPSLPGSLVIPEDPSYARNSPIITTASTVEGTFSYLSNLLGNVESISTMLDSIYQATNSDNYVNFDKVGSDWSVYGAGLGQYFVCIGLFMGVLAQILIFDRKKRVRQISCRKWYLSKMMTISCIAVLQASIFAASVAAVGWSDIGIAFLVQFFAMIFFGLIFVSILVSIWFCFRDKELSLIVIIVIMVLNLACGWGTFPAFTQWPIFYYISHVLPYTYMIHMQGAILYGLGTGIHVATAWLNIFKWAGILLIYPTIFISLGLFMSKFRERDLLYGTWNKKKLGQALKHAGLSKCLDEDDMKAKITHKYTLAKSAHAGNQDKLLKDHTKYVRALKKLETRGPMPSWKRLPHEEMPKLKEIVQLLYPYKGKLTKFAAPENDIIKDNVDFDEN